MFFRLCTAFLLVAFSVHVMAQEPSQPSESAAIVVKNAQTSLIQNTKIAAPMSGIVAAVHVSEGEWIAIRSPLIELNRELAEKEWQAAQAALDAATLKSENDVNLRYAQRALEVRENEMKQSQIANQTYPGAVSRVELEEISLQVDQAALAIEQAEQERRIARATTDEKVAAVQIARTNLDRHRVHAAVAGMVTEIDVSPGEWVEAGKPVVRVISLDPLRIECFVDGRKYGRELVNRHATFVVAGADKEITLQGKVSFVSPELQPVTGQVRLWATVVNPGGKIGAGATGTLTIATQSVEAK